MSCNGCFNGCADIVSDKCVKYTGIDIPTIGDIENGDSYFLLVEKLTTFLSTVIDGTGITPVIPPEYICELIEGYLPEGDDVNLVDILTALSRAICHLQDHIDDIEEVLTALNGDYNVDCLEGVTNSSDTHAVLQAAIDKLCEVEESLTTLTNNIPANYVSKNDIDDYIEDYLEDHDIVSDKMYKRMVPYVAVEYYGTSLTDFPNPGDGFDANGVGYGSWEQVYLCNGYNGLTPDKRGVIPVGMTAMNGGAFNTKVDPALGNPTYNTLKAISGNNYITLGVNEMPTHTHTYSVLLNDPGHRHIFFGDRYCGDHSSPTYDSYGDIVHIDIAPNSPHQNNNMKNYYTHSETNTTAKTDQTTGITLNPTAITDTGGGLKHSNIPVVMSCYYIMYIPD